MELSKNWLENDFAEGRRVEHSKGTIDNESRVY